MLTAIINEKTVFGVAKHAYFRECFYRLALVSPVFASDTTPKTAVEPCATEKCFWALLPKRSRSLLEWLQVCKNRLNCNAICAGRPFCVPVQLCFADLARFRDRTGTQSPGTCATAERGIHETRRRSERINILLAGTTQSQVQPLRGPGPITHFDRI